MNRVDYRVILLETKNFARLRQDISTIIKLSTIFEANSNRRGQVERNRR